MYRICYIEDMNKKLLVILVAAAVLIGADGTLLAYQPQIALAKNQKARFELPASAVQVADNLYSLRTAFDQKNDKQV